MSFAEALGNAVIAAAVVALIVVSAVLAVVYAIVKKKKDYNSTGIPKRVERPEAVEGSTDKKRS